MRRLRLPLGRRGITDNADNTDVKTTTMISNSIKTYREKLDLTQEELAKAVSVSRQTINAMEKGNYEPSLLLAMKLAKYFSVNVEELFKIN